MECSTSVLQKSCRPGLGSTVQWAVPAGPPTCFRTQIWERENLRHKSVCPASVKNNMSLISAGIRDNPNSLQKCSAADRFTSSAWQLCCYPAITMGCEWCFCSDGSLIPASIWRLDLPGCKFCQKGMAAEGFCIQGVAFAPQGECQPLSHAKLHKHLGQHSDM